jgi:hypothetical protein
MIDTRTLSDRAVNLLARWDELEGSPLGTPAEDIDPETAVILVHDGDVVAVSDEDDLSLALALHFGATVEEYEEVIAAEGGRLVRGIANLR